MRKLNLLFFAVMGMMMAAMPVLAQAPAATAAVDNNPGLKAIAAAVGFAIAVFGGALGQSTRFQPWVVTSETMPA